MEYRKDLQGKLIEYQDTESFVEASISSGVRRIHTLLTTPSLFHQDPTQIDFKILNHYGLNPEGISNRGIETVAILTSFENSGPLNLFIYQGTDADVPEICKSNIYAANPQKVNGIPIVDGVSYLKEDNRHSIFRVNNCNYHVKDTEDMMEIAKGDPLLGLLAVAAPIFFSPGVANRYCYDQWHEAIREQDPKTANFKQPRQLGEYVSLGAIFNGYDHYTAIVKPEKPEKSIVEKFINSKS